ncbi:11264_t:CDS:2, partial [Gigaspora rosea]
MSQQPQEENKSENGPTTQSYEFRQPPPLYDRQKSTVLATNLTPEQVVIYEEFPEILTKSKEDLEDLLSNDIVFESFFESIERIRNTIAVQNEMRMGNETIAKETLSQENELNQLRQHVQERENALIELNSTIQEKLKLQQNALQRFSPSVLLTKLKSGVQQSDELSEQMANSFLSGELETDQFIKHFREIRKVFHLRNAKGLISHGSVTFDPKYSRGIGLLTLQNPERHNALSGKMMAELSDIVDKLENVVKFNTNDNLNSVNNENKLNNVNELDKENNLIGIIVTGSRNTFCSGLDLSVAKDHILTPENGKKMSLLMQDTLFRFGQLPLISVAAVEGHALGGGAELVTACDFRCISETSKIRFVQVKMSVIPGWGGGKRLIDIVGGVNALKIMGTSDPITTQNGLELGFVDVIAPHGECVNRAREFLNRYVYFSERDERKGGNGNDDNTNENRINSVKVVRGLKLLISRTKNNEEYKNFLLYEHELFCSLWGQKENVDA